MNIKREYLMPSCTPFNMDRYIIRQAIVNALKGELPKFSGTLLDVGCGFSPYKSLVLAPPSHVANYIGLDLENNTYQKPDLVWDGERIPLEDNSVDCAIATEVLEHCFMPQQILDEIYRVLKPGGLFFLTTPFVWPLHDMPHDYFRYTPNCLESLLSNSGYEQIAISPLGGWNAACAQMLGLWVTRRSFPKVVSAGLKGLIWPVFLALIATDRRPCSFSNGIMISGLAGIAKKPTE